MAVQKLYAGTTLRELRSRLGLTQKAFAAKLDVSLPYLNQMENNHRPVSAAVVPDLPASSRRAVALAQSLFAELNRRIARTPASALKNTRVRVPNPVKARLALAALLGKVRRP